MRKRFVALLLAAMWSIGLVVAATTAPWYRSVTASSTASTNGESPVEQPVETEASSTLVEENGRAALALVSIPLLAVIVVGAALRRRHGRGQRGAGRLAWAVVGGLGVFTLAAMFSIGIFVLPVAALLAYACASTPRAPRRLDPVPVPAAR